MSKTKLAIVYGGPGEEHEVSVKSGEFIIKNIDKNKFELLELLLPKNFNISKKGARDKLRILKGYLVWPVMHGEFGEGGVLQKYLERNRIKFIGSGSKSAKLALDKFKTQNLLEKNKILCPKSYFLKNFKDLQNFERYILNKEKINFPLVLKKVDGGSSVDLHILKSMDEYTKITGSFLKRNGKALIQEYISGREFTCGVLEKGKSLLALPPTEVVLTKTEFFDYEAKYTKGACIEITPAEIDYQKTKKIQNIAKKVFKILMTKDIGRVDMLESPDGKFYVLEMNTMPGMTGTSFIPQQLKACGIEPVKFVDILIKNNLK